MHPSDVGLEDLILAVLKDADEVDLPTQTIADRVGGNVAFFDVWSRLVKLEREEWVARSSPPGRNRHVTWRLIDASD